MWRAFEDGSSIGTTGSESGIVVKDEEYDECARVTLEKDGHAPYAITCGIYGLMAHTVFFSEHAAAEKGFEDIKKGLQDFAEKLDEIDALGEDEALDFCSNWCEWFVDKY